LVAHSRRERVPSTQSERVRRLGRSASVRTLEHRAQCVDARPAIRASPNRLQDL
jgi:hypothetical protein